MAAAAAAGGREAKVAALNGHSPPGDQLRASLSLHTHTIRLDSSLFSSFSLTRTQADFECCARRQQLNLFCALNLFAHQTRAKRTNFE